MLIFIFRHTDNAVSLMDFITNNRNSQYCNYMPYLCALDRDKLSQPFNIEYVRFKMNDNCI